MKKIYTSENGAFAGYVKNVLEEQGIACFMKHENLGGAAGELPPHECWPEIWIEDNADHDRARAILDSLLKESQEGTAWRCLRCGEIVDAQFGKCWKCGADHP